MKELSLTTILAWESVEQLSEAAVCVQLSLEATMWSPTVSTRQSWLFPLESNLCQIIFILCVSQLIRYVCLLSLRHRLTCSFIFVLCLCIFPLSQSLVKEAHLFFYFYLVSLYFSFESEPGERALSDNDPGLRVHGAAVCGSCVCSFLWESPCGVLLCPQDSPGFSIRK